MLRLTSPRPWPTRWDVAVRTAPLLIVLAATLNGGGCSRGVGSMSAGESVSGTVTWQGKPLALGTIGFVPAVGEDLSGTRTMITNGRYEIPNPPGLAAGSYKVRIHARSNSRKEKGTASEAPKGVPDFNPVDPLQQELIPEKYNDETVLTAEIAQGTNTKDFDLIGTRSPAKGRPSSQRRAGAGRNPM